MDEEITTPEEQSQVDSEEAVSETTDETVETEPNEQPSVDEAEALSLDELNDALGKKFKSKDSALRSLKETNKFVGKKKEEAVKEASKEYDNLRAELDALKQENFYSKNPHYEPYKNLIEKLGNRDEVVKTKEFKEVFDKLKTAEEPEKSIIHSNARIGETSSEYNRDFEQAQKTGDWSVFLSKHKGIKVFEE